MFRSYEFTFDGKSSKMFGLMLYDIGGRGQSDVAFGNAGAIQETRTLRRVKPIHFGVNYHGSPLQFKLVFGTDAPLDRYDLETVAMWLTGHQDYKWLTVDEPDLTEVRFRCIITGLQPISVGWSNYAFEATVTCDCPYAYGPTLTAEYAISGETEVLFRNDSTAREYLYPYLTFTPGGGTTSLSITNEEDGGREFLLGGLPSPASITVDNENGILTETLYGTNLYPGFNLHFLRLLPGDNHLTVNGNGTLTLQWCCLYNVGA